MVDLQYEQIQSKVKQVIARKSSLKLT